jgi:hypothetical protein
MSDSAQINQKNTSFKTSKPINIMKYFKCCKICILEINLHVMYSTCSNQKEAYKYAMLYYKGMVEYKIKIINIYIHNNTF